MTTPSPTASPTTRGRPLPPPLPLLPLLEEKKVGGGSSGGGKGPTTPSPVEPRRLPRRGIREAKEEKEMEKADMEEEG
jgi:hypothetical protein